MSRKQPQQLPEEYRNGTTKPMSPSLLPRGIKPPNNTPRPCTVPPSQKTQKSKNKPKSINILGIDYSIEYCDKPSEVDLYKRDSLWGQVDYWTRTIRVYDNGRKVEDIWQTIIHEMLHVIGNGLKLECLNKGDLNDDKKHDELDMIALALTDTLFRNDLIKVKTE